jgi:hypothetical protein
VDPQVTMIREVVAALRMNKANPTRSSTSESSIQLPRIRSYRGVKGRLWAVDLPAVASAPVIAAVASAQAVPLALVAPPRDAVRHRCVLGAAGRIARTAPSARAREPLQAVLAEDNAPEQSNVDQAAPVERHPKADTRADQVALGRNDPKPEDARARRVVLAAGQVVTG